MNRTSLALLLWMVVASCTVTSNQLRTQRELRSGYTLGTGRGDTYGMWYPQAFNDGTDSMPHDTTWTLLVRNPQYVAYDDHFLLVKNAKGKVVITTMTTEGNRTWKCTKSEERYQELRTELSVPKDLVLQAIEPPKRGQ